MVAGPSQRNRAPYVIQALEVVIKPVGIFNREPVGEDVIIRIVIIQPGLDTCILLTDSPEEDDCPLELIGIGGILSIIDYAELPLGPAKPVVAGTRLGPDIGIG
jgi:hypothetical protein